MEDNNKNVKITYTKNLSKLNFNSTLSIPIDASVNIKNLLDVHTYLYDQKVECGNGKAIISGKIGLKALYIDTDNITNTITDSLNFTETYIDSSITSECYLNIGNSNIVNNILSSNGSLKVNCEVSIAPVVYLNLGLNHHLLMNEDIVSRKNEIKTNVMGKIIDTNFDYTTNLETKDHVSKILCYNSYFIAEKTIPFENGAIVEGKLYSKLIYETNSEETSIKTLTETFPLKCDINSQGIEKDSLLDLTFMLDKNKEEILTEMEDDSCVISIKHNIKACGVELKTANLNLVDDIYSTSNELEIVKSTREFTKNAEQFNITDIVSNEINLLDTETAIDEIVANLNIVPEITNSYIKDNYLVFEGIVTSNLTYVDENKEYKQKQTELPFIINTKVPLTVMGCIHTNISILDSRVKVKRGTIIELEYSLFCSVVLYEKESFEIVDNYTLGKSLDFSKYDYQIFIAKPNETMWELCKRIKITPEKISQYNKDLPLVMQGGEKIVIKR